LKQGEKISNLENASQNLIHLPLTICKKTLKRIYKRICKNKTCGVSVVQNVKNKETFCWNSLSAARRPTRVNSGDNRVTCTGAIALFI
jgi:hypothetical protein